MESLERLASSREVSVVARFPEEIPRVTADRDRLRQVLTNLMDNAIRFTEEGQIKISVSSGPPTPDGADTIAISLADSGVGIAADEIEAVFERFQQVDGSITRAHGGSGLGLAICEDLVKLMNGNITVSSEMGLGTSFTVTLPVDGTTEQGVASE